MTDSDLQNVIWYVEARADGLPDQPAQMGSGVVVWLEKKADGTRKKYLLTCAHVVRAPAADGTIGSGNLLSDILVWMPTKGFTKPSDIPNRTSTTKVPGSYRARVSTVTPASPEEIPTAQRLAATDWTLLEVDDQEFQQAASVSDWSGESGMQLSVIGYPGGSLDWKTGTVVTPTISRLFELHTGAGTSIWTLTGPSETRGGMSGGGVFDEQGRLVGLHRSRQDLQMAGQAIVASHIQSELNALGYKVVPYTVSEPEPLPPEESRWQRLNLALIAMSFLAATVWSIRVLGLHTIPLIGTLISAVGLSWAADLVFPKRGFRELARAILRRLRSVGTSIVLVILCAVGGLLSCSGTCIHVTSLPDDEKQVQIRWDADRMEEELTLNQPKWFWTWMRSTRVSFASPGFVTVTKEVAPWTQTVFPGAIELKHRPFVVVWIGPKSPPSFPKRDDKDSFQWRLRVTRWPVANPANPVVWEPESSYYAGDPLWLGGDGLEWPTEKESPAGIEFHKIFQPKSACPLTAQDDYTIELLNQNKKDVEFRCVLSHEDIAKIRGPLWKKLERP